MALRIRCTCGKTLAVPDSLMGRKVACPGCKKTYRATPPAPEQKSEIELPPIDPASTPSELNLLEGIELMPRIGPTCPRCKKAQPPEARICVTCGVDLLTGKSVFDKSSGGPTALSYAENTKPGLRARAAGREIVGEPKRSYAADALLAFAYPVKSGRDLLTLLAIEVVALLLVVFRLPFMLMLPEQIILNGWLAAVYLRVVEHTAIAVDELPGIRWDDGPIEDIIKPGFRFAGALLCALTPAALFAVLLATGLIPPPLRSIAVILTWLAAGVFMWPLLVILFTFGATGKLYRIDLLIQAVFRTAQAYFILWILLLFVGACFLLPIIGPILDGYGVKNSLPSIDDLGIGGAVAIQALGVYLMLVAMRQIGLYYLHFKNRIAFLFD
ncbi:MAG: hypothetical protein HZA51_16760 [Planctomycetes bacterium]|nr:hypothetical protein [Planctomycetota bacterium]